MGTEKIKLQGRDGIKQLDRVGHFLVITNGQLYKMGASRRYTRVNMTELSLHSIHGSQRAAVTFAQKHIQ